MKVRKNDPLLRALSKFIDANFKRYNFNYHDQKSYVEENFQRLFYLKMFSTDDSNEKIAEVSGVSTKTISRMRSKLRRRLR